VAATECVAAPFRQRGRASLLDDLIDVQAGGRVHAVDVGGSGAFERREDRVGIEVTERLGRELTATEATEAVGSHEVVVEVVCLFLGEVESVPDRVVLPQAHVVVPGVGAATDRGNTTTPGTEVAIDVRREAGGSTRWFVGRMGTPVRGV